MKIGTERIYNKAFKDIENVILWDVIKFIDGQRFIVRFISTKSENRQGIRLAIDVGKGYFEIEGTKSKNIAVWADTAPKEFICTLKSDIGLLSIYNIWEDKGGFDSQSYSSGMLVEENENKYVYKCNDYGFETNFDKLVFEIEKI